MRIHPSAVRRNESEESSETTPSTVVSKKPISQRSYRQSNTTTHEDHYIEGFIPDYVLQDAQQRIKDPDILRALNKTRQDMRMINLSKDPKYLEKLRAKELYERVYINGEDPATFSARDRDILSRFADWLKKLFDSIFGKKKSPKPGDAKKDGSRFVHSAEQTSTLRKKTVRSEGQTKSGDKDVDDAFDYAGELRTFLKDVLQYNSLDNAGMNLHQTVHYGKEYNNAFWNGQEMAYGDGDGKIFKHFSQDSTVIHHELGHGLVQHHNKNGGLNYRDESGALNESFADINAVVMKQYMGKVNAATASRDMWLIGAQCMVPYKDKNGVMQYPALRSFLDEKSYKDHPQIGTDRQPKNMKDKYTGSGDNGGVHINSGIPNHAFYLAARDIGGKSWTTTYQIWWKALEVVPSNSTFKQFAMATVESGIKLTQGVGSDLKKADIQKVVNAWKKVGVLTDADKTAIDALYKKYGFDPAFKPFQGLKKASGF